MKPGTKLRCIDAKETGIPVTEGEVYTVKRYVRCGVTAWGEIGDGPIEERRGLPGVTLEEAPGFFMAARFEPVEAE